MADAGRVDGVAIFTCTIMHPHGETVPLRRPVSVPAIEGENAEQTMARLREEAKHQYLPSSTCQLRRIFFSTAAQALKAN